MYKIDRRGGGWGGVQKPYIRTDFFFLQKYVKFSDILDKIDFSLTIYIIYMYDIKTMQLFQISKM